MVAEQGRWESARWRVEADHREREVASWVLNGRHTSMDLLENTASRFRIAFGGACVTSVSKLYCLGQHNLDWILADLSASASRYFERYLYDGSGRWDFSSTDRREQHAFDVYNLLLKSSLSLSYHPEQHLSRSIELRRQDLSRPRRFDNIRLEPGRCLEFLAVADECLRRPWWDCLTGPLVCCGSDWKGRWSSPYPPTNGQWGGLHRVLETLLAAVLQRRSWSGTFFITVDGRLGIGPESTQPGDQIVVLDGARSPFVLRPLTNSTDYALLGDSYVLGLMHGEVKNMDERGKLQSRKIVIQ